MSGGLVGETKLKNKSDKQKCVLLEGTRAEQAEASGFRAQTFFKRSHFPLEVPSETNTDLVTRSSSPSVSAAC